LTGGQPNAFELYLVGFSTMAEPRWRFAKASSLHTHTHELI